MQRAARYQICRPEFESRQGTSMWFPLEYCDVKYKYNSPAHHSGHPGGAMQVIRPVSEYKNNIGIVGKVKMSSSFGGAEIELGEAEAPPKTA